MNPGVIVLDGIEPGDKFLSLCCGIGFELKNADSGNLSHIDMTGVDIVPEYIAVFSERYPHAKTEVSDAVKYISKCEDNSFDVISVIDGIEHITKKQGLKLIKECKRVARKKVFIFTPEGFTKNEPHHAWGIEAGDEEQHHISGWEIKEFTSRGFELIRQHPSRSLLGTDFNESMYVYTKNM